MLCFQFRFKKELPLPHSKSEFAPKASGYLIKAHSLEFSFSLTFLSTNELLLPPFQNPPFPPFFFPLNFFFVVVFFFKPPIPPLSNKSTNPTRSSFQLKTPPSPTHFPSTRFENFNPFPPSPFPSKKKTKPPLSISHNTKSLPQRDSDEP